MHPMAFYLNSLDTKLSSLLLRGNDMNRNRVIVIALTSFLIVAGYIRRDTHTLSDYPMDRIRIIEGTNFRPLVKRNNVKMHYNYERADIRMRKQREVNINYGIVNCLHKEELVRGRNSHNVSTIMFRAVMINQYKVFVADNANGGLKHAVEKRISGNGQFGKWKFMNPSTFLLFFSHQSGMNASQLEPSGRSVNNTSARVKGEEQFLYNIKMGAYHIVVFDSGVTFRYDYGRIAINLRVPSRSRLE